MKQYLASPARPFPALQKPVQSISPVDAGRAVNSHVLIRGIIGQTWGCDDLLEVDDVLVVQLLEDFDLADGRDRELRRVTENSEPRNHEGKEKEGATRTPTPSRSLSMRIFLSATISFVSVSFAMNTCLKRDNDAAELEQRIGDSRDWGTEIGGSIERVPVCSLADLLELLEAVDAAGAP
jgi:hypothetical protein